MLTTECIGSLDNKTHMAIKQVAHDFEAIFASHLWQIVFKNENDNVEKSVYNAMLIEEYGKLLAPAMNLSDAIVASIVKMRC